MLKLPFTPWTPPIHVITPDPPRPEPDPPSSGSGSGGSGGHSGSGSGSGGSGGHSGSGSGSGGSGGHSGSGSGSGGSSGHSGSGSGSGGSGGHSGSGSGSGGSGGHSGSGSGSGDSQPQIPVMEIPSLESLFAEMLNRYLPETVEFTPIGEDVLRDTIRNWLRPAYEEAIRRRREQTERVNAELDADAWSRGMGQSTYLTDVKERQLRGESQDIDTLESDYASSLAAHLYDALEEQQKQQVAVDEFNAEQINRAREKASAAARELYQAYLSAAQMPAIDIGHGGSSGGGHAGAASETEDPADSAETLPSFTESILHSPAADEIIRTDYSTAANLLARMSPHERSRLYNRADPGYLSLRAELIYSLGESGFNRLMQEFPGE